MARFFRSQIAENYALHMFDARVVCSGHIDLRDAAGGRTGRHLKANLDGRIACDPVVWYNRARNLCRQRDAPPGAFLDLDLFLWARRATDAEMKAVIAVEGFCARGIRYNPFWHNAWIRAG